MSLITPPVVDNKPRSFVVDPDAFQLQRQLQTARRRQIVQRIAVGICLLTTGVAIVLAISAVADYFWEISTVWRTTWLIGNGGFAAVAAIVLWRRWITCYTLSNTAADAEARLAKFGQRLRTTLDYQQQSPEPAAASPGLLKALHRETLHVSERVEWDDAVDTRPLLACVFLGCIVIGMWIIALIASPEFRISTARAFALPAEYTTVSFTPQDATVRFGESVIVKAMVAGRPIESAELKYRPAGSIGDWQSLQLVPAEEAANKDSPQTRASAIQATAATTAVEKQKSPLHGELVATLSRLDKDLEFVVVAGPRDLSPGAIRVLQPLTLEKPQAHIAPPSYTGRKDETVESLSLKILEGSTVEFRMQLSRAASSATLARMENNAGKSAANRPSGKDAIAGSSSTANAAEIPLRLQDNLVLFTLADLRSNAAFTFSAQAADGMTLDPVKIDIRVQLDRKPQVEFIEPPEELVVTPTTEVPMIVDASDDLGLQKVGVLYQVGSGPLQTLIEQTADGSAEPFRLSSLLMLEDHQVKYPDAVTYYAFAEDNYFGQPRRTTTPLRFIDIRPYKMEFQVVDSQGGSCNGCSQTLEELIARQRQNLSLTFAAKDDAKPAKAVTERLLSNQSELLGATIEFEAGLKERGASVASLQAAVTSMEKAIAAIQSPRLPDAVAAEQESLSALIHARENLRKILKQSNSQSASACRKFDRQQRQKLRMPEKKPDDQQQIAAVRAKLDDLAKRERKWSEDARQACQCSSSSSKSGKPSQSSASSPSQQAQSQAEQSPQQQAQESNAQQESQSAQEKSDKPTPADVATAQEKLQKELAELQTQLDKFADNAKATGIADSGQAAGQQAQQAAESMQQGLDEVKRQDGEAAAKAGERSAQQLEQLSAHLAAMNARDFGQRLDQAQKTAQQLAVQQTRLAENLERAKESPGDAKASESSKRPADATNGNESGGSPGGDQIARDERALAAQTEMLADLLERLKGNSVTENAGVREKLEQIHAENPPRDIAAEMRRTADDLQASRSTQAAPGAAAARDRLQELGQTLAAARGEYAQPQLKELMELEEQVAQLQKQLQRAEGQKSPEAGAAAEKWQQLEPRLDRMAEADKRLAEALRQLHAAQANASEAGKSQTKPGSQLAAAPYVEGSETPRDGFYPGVQLGNFGGLREVSKALQAKIQEAILAGALLDADQPVPPAYKELVEKYYRTLSDDLK